MQYKHDTCHTYIDRFVCRRTSEMEYDFEIKKEYV